MGGIFAWWCVVLFYPFWQYMCCCAIFIFQELVVLRHVWFYDDALFAPLFLHLLCHSLAQGVYCPSVGGLSEMLRDREFLYSCVYFGLFVLPIYFPHRWFFRAWTIFHCLSVAYTCVGIARLLVFLLLRIPVCGCSAYVIVDLIRAPQSIVLFVVRIWSGGIFSWAPHHQFFFSFWSLCVLWEVFFRCLTFTSPLIPFIRSYILFVHMEGSAVTSVALFLGASISDLPHCMGICHPSVTWW